MVTKELTHTFVWANLWAINKGYKTGIRDDWFVIPSIKLSDALFIRRNNLYPRLISEFEANAYTTDTMHSVFMKKHN
jgi:adenine-specific DNA-methyltransferase